MKLKDSTFAIVAEKKGSISHNWFNENIKDNQEPLSWGLDGKWIYYYEKGDWDVVLTNSFKKDCPIYTEYVFESLLKAEQENEATQTFGGMTSTGGNAQTFPKNTVFGKENIAHKSVFNPNGFSKPFKGVTITKSEAEKILRDKFKLPDYVEFKIVE